jgi:hypothetical protein
MKLNDYLRLLAGFFTIISVVLSIYVSPKFIYFTLFIGLNQLQSAFTKWCPAIWFLNKLGIKE